MQGNYAVLGVVAIAAFWTTATSTDALAAACSSTLNYFANSTMALGSCTQIGETVSIFIENRPTTVIYNLVDNSIDFQMNGAVSVPINNFIVSMPTTNIYNLVDNSVNLQLTSVVDMPINIFIDSEPTTIIYNLVDNSVNYLDTAALAGATIGTLIESAPTTTIYNIIDNSVHSDVTSVYMQQNIALTGPENPRSSSEVAAAAEPASLPLLGVALGALSLFQMGRRTRKP